MPLYISDIVSFLESLAHPSLQESYDNAGLITGQPAQPCTGIICSLDVTEAVIEEAVSKGCNLVEKDQRQQLCGKDHYCCDQK